MSLCTSLSVLSSSGSKGMSTDFHCRKIQQYTAHSTTYSRDLSHPARHQHSVYLCTSLLSVADQDCPRSSRLQRFQRLSYVRASHHACSREATQLQDWDPVDLHPEHQSSSICNNKQTAQDQTIFKQKSLSSKDPEALLVNGSYLAFHCFIG